MSKVQFKISSALKTIIGKELITDDFIAVFELVKNSFDANAKEVNITIDTGDPSNSRIIISDDGDGMSEDDIKEKWLFVAYSSKKSQRDYRDQISSGRVFAGAKGIGRFSCDRLGEKLTIYTKKRSRLSKGQFNQLSLDWNNFEVDAKTEFQSISGSLSQPARTPYDFPHGTVIEISNLRSHDWDRKKMLDLRRSLERLVNPNQENDAHNFRIVLHCADELEEDRSLKRNALRKGESVKQWQIVNGPIRNFIFETLDLKTAQIVVEVDEKGENLYTKLTERGRLVYQLVESNPFPKTLHDIRITLFALNQAAKKAFTLHMGMRAFYYGSVFLYKNGFRIHPFGDPSDDKLGIANRYAQGVFRRLGTRDLSGRIEINGHNDSFKETSSRDGGLIQNQAFFDLKSLVIDFALKRLETFTIDLARFGTEKGELPDAASMSKSEVRQAIFDIITGLTQSEAVLDIQYNPDFLDILENKSAESVSSLLLNLKRIAAKEKSPSLSKEVVRAERQLSRLKKAKQQAEEGETRERQRAKHAEEQARQAQAKAAEAEEKARAAAAAAREAEYRQKKLNTQNIFLQSIVSKEMDHVVSLHHSIGQDALTIEQYVQNLLNLIRNEGNFNPQQLSVGLERISKVASKINTISRLATRANSVAAQEEATTDLIQYIREYLLNVYGGFIHDPHRKPIPIQFAQDENCSFVTTFPPIDISIIFDNLISNARKHRSKNIQVAVVEVTEGHLIISFSNDGDSIPKEDMPHIFKMGFTTTEGSGIGLHHTSEIMDELSGRIMINSNRRKGVEFLLTFPRQ